MNKHGRPRKEKKMIEKSISFHPDTIEMLDQYAAKRNITFQEAARHFICMGLLIFEKYMDAEPRKD